VNEWVICKSCGLKYRTREPVCPRCDAPPVEGQVRYGEDRAPPGPPERSPFVVALPVGLVLAALGTFLFAGPLEGRASGTVTLALVGAGLVLLCVSWAWTATVAFHEGLGWVFLAILAPFVSTALLRKWKALGVKVAGVGLVVLGVGVFAPKSGLADDIVRECKSKAADTTDCACIGPKTVGLMGPEERKQPFSKDNALTRELMLTAGALCIKDRLVARCVSGEQGSEALCVCVMDAAVNAFTPDELNEALGRAIAGAAPTKYSNIRADCAARLESGKK
jgi:hypothetical protein